MKTLRALLRVSRWQLPVLTVLVGLTFFFLDRAYARATSELTLRQADTGQEIALAFIAQLGPVAARDAGLYAGETRLDGATQVVDAVKAATGLGCAIYRGRSRIASAPSAPGAPRDTPTPEGDDELGLALAGLTFRGVLQSQGRDFFVVYRPLRDASGQIVGVLATFTDRDDFGRGLLTFRLVLGGALTMLTGLLFLLVLRVEQQERDFADARHREAEARARLRNQFFASMSHELRTPLSAVLAFAGSLRDGGSSREVVADVAARIEQVSRDLIGIINNILDAAKLESQNVELMIEDVDVAEALQRVVRKCEPLVGVKPVRVSVDAPPALPRVRADFVKLQQVLTNLVGNAIKFTEQGQVRIRAFVEPGCVAVEVADTGVGIPAEALPDIFIAFRQADGSIARRYGGSGLGLSIVHGLVRLMHGAIDVQSSVGAGSTFTVRLPASTNV